VHNIVEDELEQGAFDLVHARGVLVHLSRRDTVLERMVSALRPGGLLLVEEPDNSSFVADPRAGPAACELLAKVLSAIQMATGIDAQYGRRLYADVCAFGLLDVGAEGRAVFGRGGGTPDAQFMRLTLTQLRDRIIGTGQVSPEELDTLIALFDDPHFVWMGPMGVAAWGRRPIG
jgi:SAM-dependent methyltransferase